MDPQPRYLEQRAKVYLLLARYKEAELNLQKWTKTKPVALATRTKRLTVCWCEGKISLTQSKLNIFFFFSIQMQGKRKEGLDALNKFLSKDNGDYWELYKKLNTINKRKKN